MINFNETDSQKHEEILAWKHETQNIKLKIYVINFPIMNNLYSWIYCSYTLHILFHSKTNTTLFYLLSLAFIRFYLLYHSLSFVVMRYQLFSLTVIRCHSLSLVVPLVATCFHSLYHSVSFIATHCITRSNLSSLDVPLVCYFINDQIK